MREMVASGSPLARLEADGNFSLENVYPGSYRIVPMNDVPGYFLDSIRLGETETSTSEVEIAPFNLASKWSLKTSRIRRIGNRFSGTCSPSSSEEHAPLDYQRRPRRPIPPDVGPDSAATGAQLRSQWGTITASGARFRYGPKSAPLPSGILPHIAAECCPTSNGISAPLRPESASASVAGEFREIRHAAYGHPENESRNVGRNYRDDSFTGELLHEPVPQARIR